jgi:hypothetical protein
MFLYLPAIISILMFVLAQKVIFAQVIQSNFSIPFRSTTRKRLIDGRLTRDATKQVEPLISLVDAPQVSIVKQNLRCPHTRGTSLSRASTGNNLNTSYP